MSLAGRTANTGENQNRAPGLIASVSVFTGVALLVTLLRIHVRLCGINRFGVDDAVILLAMTCSLVALCCNGLSVSQGYGKHKEELTTEQQVWIRKYFLASTITLLFGQALARVGISLMLLRLLGNAASKGRKVFLHGMNVFVFIYTTIDIIENLTFCEPLSKTWNLDKEGSCKSVEFNIGFASMQGACSAAAAFILSSLPMVFFGKLQMDIKTKAPLISLMSLGVFDGILCIVRSALLPGQLKSFDFTYTPVPVPLLGSLELNFAIIAACVPTIRPLFRSYSPMDKVTSYRLTRQGFIKQGSWMNLENKTGAQRRLGHSNGRHVHENTPNTQSFDGSGAITKTTEISVQV